MPSRIGDVLIFYQVAYTFTCYISCSKLKNEIKQLSVFASQRLCTLEALL